MKTLLYSLAGFLAATIVIWAGLFAWAAIFLSPADSYWDRSSNAADLFFLGWITLALLAAIAAGKMSRRRGRAL